MTPFQSIKLALVTAALSRNTVREVLHAADESHFNELAVHILSNRIPVKEEEEKDAYSDLNA